MKTWYTSKGSGGQGLVIEEDTGRTVAVAYDEKDAAMLAAAPALAEALRGLLDGGYMVGENRAEYRAVCRAVCRGGWSALAAADGKG